LVLFNGEPAEIISGTVDSLVVIVPDAATDGPITITANGTTDNTFDDFIVDTESVMFAGKVRTCSTVFVEPNGSDDFVQTFVPGTPGAKVRVRFTSFNVDDELNIYDGPGTSSPLLAKSADIKAGDEFVATSASGELTFEFLWLDSSSDWTADISCDGVVKSILISTQPAASAVCNGMTATFTTAASGTTNLAYKWQYSADGVAVFNDINDGAGYSNTATATLTVNTKGNFGGGFYQCRVNGDSAPEQITSSAKLTINSANSPPCFTPSELVVFNAVSPNGDGKNDTFLVEYIDIVPGKAKNKVRIVNRWGDEVFSATDYNNNDRVFDGTNNKGNKLPGGIYYYWITFADGSDTLSGYLELRY
jgi:gliding motility-associated-like protein